MSENTLISLNFPTIITPQFRICTFLENIDVSSNSLTGDIPCFLFGLPKLQELTLNKNEFTTINGIGNSSSSQLEHLDILLNMISGNIPDFFHSFPYLNYFSANSNNLSGGIPPSLSNSQSISSLNKRNYSLDGEINFNCSMLVNPTSLDLAKNSFSGTIPANLASCRKLKALNLSRNKLIGQIPDSFKYFESLSYISLSNCNFSNLSTSLRILQHCPNLTVLVVSMNFRNEQLPSGDDLQFKALKALAMSYCSLTGSISSWLQGLTQLQLLDLSWNHLTGSIPAYLGEFKSKAIPPGSKLLSKIRSLIPPGSKASHRDLN